MEPAADRAPRPSAVATSSEPAAPLGHLAFKSAVVEGTKVTITGTTDMPDDTKVSVTFDVWGRPGSAEYIGVDGDAMVSSGKFSIELDVPQRKEFKKGAYSVSLLVTPRAQSNAVLEVIGADGENLLGPQSKKSDLGFKTLEAEVKTNLRPTVTPAKYAFQNPSAFPSGSAERALAEYMRSWKARDWAKMLKFTQITWRKGESNPAEMISAWHDFKTLKGFKILKVKRTTSVANDINYVIWYEAQANKIQSKLVTARVIKEAGAYTPSASGVWGVNPVSTLGERDY
ncbi:MAG: hypothetical protein C4521_04235 [Actinobacteria bacterium]|nr:MAG: hypothetical protein C4521_04235 [Actinomycetota bacterium]